MKTVEFEMFGEKLRMLVAGLYRDNSRVVRVECVSDGSPYAELTCYARGAGVGEGEFLVKTWSENEALYHQLVGYGLVKPTANSIPTGHDEAVVCTIPLLEE